MDRVIQHVIKEIYLTIEWLAIFVGVPIVLYFTGTPGTITTLLIIAALCWVALFRMPNYHYKWLRGLVAIKWKNFERILLLFLLSAMAIALFTFEIERDRFLRFPFEKPLTWLAVMIIYPVLSVYPQEIIYRLFFFKRYETLFPNKWVMITMSALAFGFAHIIFYNYIAVLFSTVGGFLFAYTYHKHGSLLLTSIEHTMYGCFIFTIGLGWYFHGSGGLPSPGG